MCSEIILVATTDFFVLGAHLKASLLFTRLECDLKRDSNLDAVFFKVNGETQRVLHSLHVRVRANFLFTRLYSLASSQKGFWLLNFCRNCRFMKPFVLMCSVCLFVRLYSEGKYSQYLANPTIRFIFNPMSFIWNKKENEKRYAKYCLYFLYITNKQTNSQNKSQQKVS